MNDGRTIVVTQKKKCYRGYTGQDFATCLVREAWLTINLPDISNAEIVWNERLLPIVLNVHERQLYIVGVPPKGREYDLYSQPSPPYIPFIFDVSIRQWRRIPLADLPISLYDTNMLIAGTPLPNVNYISVAENEIKNLMGDPATVHPKSVLI